MAEFEETQENLMDEEAFDNDCKVRGLNANDKSVVFPAATFLDKDFRGLALTTTDPGTSNLNGDYFIADESGDFTHFSLTGVKNSDWLVYNGTSWLLHARGLDQIPTDVRWFKDGNVIKLQYWDGAAWVSTGTEEPI